MMFNKGQAEKILAGKQTAVSLVKPLYKEGDVTNLMADEDYSKATGKYVKITAVYAKELGKFTEDDSRKEGFDSHQDFKKHWEDKIGWWDPDKTVWVHNFEVIKKT